MKRANKTIMKCYHQELATVDEHTPTCLPSLSPSLLILYICCINCFILIIHVSFKFPAMLAILNHTARHAPRRSFRSSQVWSQPPPPPPRCTGRLRASGQSHRIRNLLQGAPLSTADIPSRVPSGTSRAVQKSMVGAQKTDRGSLSVACCSRTLLQV